MSVVVGSVVTYPVIQYLYMQTRAEQLRALIEATSSEEKACQPFLHDIALHLVPVRVSSESILVAGREEASRPGNSDFCISVDIDNGAVGRRYAYVWEVKAPQKYLFEPDTATNRLRPSDELYSAENQLVNYVAELGRSQNFRDKFQLTGVLDEVRVGGIIIGRRGRMVRNQKSGDLLLDGLARNAFTTREAFLWGPAGIRVCTWDWVYGHLLNDELGTLPATNLQSEWGMTSKGLLAYAREQLSRRDEISLRTAVTLAYSAVEMTVMPSGWKRSSPLPSRDPSPLVTVRRIIEAAGRHHLWVLCSQLQQTRNRSIHLYTESVTEASAVYAVHAAEQICSEWDNAPAIAESI